MIRFNTQFEYVGMVGFGQNSVVGIDHLIKWVVRSEEYWKRSDINNIKNNKAVEEVFDAVVVATDHYSSPRLPSM
ncbi:FAD/NAD(P)-binding domain containing protein [Parasponia andersonii]|uniref:FAD/NAD(P)-binding domain containing protein n=1 Tax=Parasponia andersonii TaxID=3476 RepID=A0A2P5D6N3_PARAD|nr:FAD/NAD(P)-binding domain containing protein [Parasponia andersonii]